MISVWKIPKFWKYYNMNKEKERKIIIVWIKNCVNSELFERISFEKLQGLKIWPGYDDPKKNMQRACFKSKILWSGLSE